MVSVGHCIFILSGCPCAGKNSRILNVLSFNILEDFEKCPFRDESAPAYRKRDACLQAMADLIIDYEADLVGFQEITTWDSGWTVLLDIVDMLNRQRPGAGRYMYTAPRFTTVITRLPVLGRNKWKWPGASGILAEAAPGVGVYFHTVHTTAYPYGPYTFRDAASRPDVQQRVRRDIRWQVKDALGILEDLRSLPGGAPEILRAVLRAPAFSALPAAHFPIILSGDFNQPSHLDATAKVAASPHYAVQRWLPVTEFVWPVSKLFQDYGYRDCYREARQSFFLLLCVDAYSYAYALYVMLSLFGMCIACKLCRRRCDI